MTNVIRLADFAAAQSEASPEKELAQRVESGRTVGYMLLEMHSTRDFTITIDGVCKLLPRLTREMLDEFDVSLAEQSWLREVVE